MLQPCPDKPNCVSSLAKDQDHFIEPLQLKNTIDSAVSELVQIISDLPRTQLIKQENHYLHFTFTSLIFRFVDDVEFYLDSDKKLVHVRSASRVGYSDFGVNRKRIEKIRQLMQSDSR